MQAIGALAFAAGLGIAFLGPVEMYCFYLFGHGGRFYYEGFGFGSFMFANIAVQIVGYYFIGAAGMALGYGHLRLRRWARSLALTLLWFWLVAGMPLLVVAYGMYVQAKEPSLATVVLTLPLAALLYPVAPLVLLRFYQSESVAATFASHDPAATWLDSIPLPVRGFCLVSCLYIFSFHVAILLNGAFPLMGALLTGLKGIVALDCSIFVLAGLTWGLARLKPWAWWGSLLAFGFLTVSSALTFARTSFEDLLLRLELPATETEAFLNVPFLDYHPVVPAVIPLLATIAILLALRQYFRPSLGT